MEAKLYKRFTKNPKRLINSYWLIDTAKDGAKDGRLKYPKRMGYAISGKALCRVSHVTKKFAIFNDADWETYRIPLEFLLLGDSCTYLGDEFLHSTYVEDTRNGWLYSIERISSQHIYLELIRANLTQPLGEWIEYPDFNAVLLNDYIRYFRAAPMSNADSLQGNLRSRIRDIVGQEALHRLLLGTYDAPNPEPIQLGEVAVNRVAEPEPVRTSSWERLTADD